MDYQSKKGNSHIKMETQDFEDYDPMTSFQGSTIDEQCLPCNGLDSNSHTIKMEVDCDKKELKREFPSQGSFDRLKTECYYDGEDESVKKAISTICEECQAHNNGYCLMHGPLMPIEDVASNAKSCNPMKNFPPNLSIKRSSIAEADLGVFALKEIPIGSRFGPYKGKKVVKGATDEFTDTSYMCEIMKDGKISHYVDGKVDAESNWMRYINCSRIEGEQNLLAFQHNNEIYYQALKTIKINDELLVWYGDEYASGLGKVFDDLDRDDTSCKETTLSNNTVGNHKNCSTKELKTDHLSYIIVKCQNCAETYSRRLHLKENHERLEYVCDNCSRNKQSSVKGDYLLEVTCKVEATELASQIVETKRRDTAGNVYTLKETELASEIVETKMTKIHETARNVYTSKEPRSTIVKDKPSTAEGMVSKSYYEDIITQKHTNHIHQLTSCQIVDSDSTVGHQREKNKHNPIKKEIHQSLGKQLGTLKRQKRTHSGDKVKCELCQFAACSLAGLKTHVEAHSGEKPYKCEICQYACSQLGHLKSHLRTHSGEKPYKCEVCKSAFRQLGHLKCHLRTHSGEKPYKCELCQYACSQSAHLKSHMKTHSGEKPYKCQICKYACSESGRLKKHMRTHSGEKPYKCEVCQYACSQLCHLKTHMRIHSGEKPYNCKYCQHAFSQSSTLKRHMRTHSGEMPYKCKYCHYTSSEWNIFERHMGIHSGEKPYKCQMCQYESSRRVALKVHILTHSGEKPYKCEICQYACSQLYTLKTHMRTHGGEKPYKCEFCSSTFNRLGNLNRHVRAHSGEKPYKCEVCQYAFCQLIHLKSHMRIHSGERPYKCEICQYAGRESGSLKKHMRTHSKQKPYKCEMRQYASSRSVKCRDTHVNSSCREAVQV